MRTRGQERCPGRGPSGPGRYRLLGGTESVEWCQEGPSLQTCWPVPPPRAPAGPLLGAGLVPGKTGAAFSLLQPLRPQSQAKPPPASHVRLSHQSPGCPPLPAHSRLQASLPRQRHSEGLGNAGGFIMHLEHRLHGADVGQLPARTAEAPCWHPRGAAAALRTLG